jgi:hypothetical protein
MKKILMALTMTCFSTLMAQAQSELSTNLPLTRVEPLQISLLQVESPQQVPSQILPDDLIPVVPALQDGPAPCPFGNGKSCALLGGRAYFSDPIHMTEHDATWVKAAGNPGMLVAFAFNFAATIADAEGTQACLHARACREANPLFGSNPSRARTYGMGIPIELASFAGFALAKKRGQGNLAFLILWASTVAHTYFAESGFTASHTSGPRNVNSASRSQYSLSIRF